MKASGVTNKRKKSKNEITALAPAKKPSEASWDGSLENLPVSDRIKSLILRGNDGTYPSRSETDQAVITALVNKGLSITEIEAIFQKYPIGEKYREHKSPASYLNHNIEKAKKYSDLTEQEISDPLFINNAIKKHDNNKYSLDIVQFQEYIVKKHRVKYLDKERCFFQYDGKCYVHCTDDTLNNLCQMELGKHRNLFVKKALASFIHYSIGDVLVDTEKAQDDWARYLTFQNGLYDLVNRCLIPHTPEIFTTNLLPYDFDLKATCPRFLQFLDEVFMGDKETIEFVQEAVGYAFLKSIPKPALFFLVGTGSNGKSVFIDTITNLVGKNNASNVSLRNLSNEYYILELRDKMINTSSETPSITRIDTDIVKAVVGGDWVTGRNLYKHPTKFKPFAKHFLAMNELPQINDSSHGMWRRLYLINFPREFSEQEMDVHLTEKLKKELSGIFNWALKGYSRLSSKNYVFTSGKSMSQSKTQYRKQSDSVEAFASDFLNPRNNSDSVKFKDVYDRYQGYCNSEGFRKFVSRQEFKKRLQLKGYKIIRSSKHANQVRIFGVNFDQTVE